MTLLVHQFEYRKAAAPETLDSGGLGPCIVVGAIYETTGYMAHYHTVSDSTTELDKLLDDLQQDVTDTGKLKMYIAGGMIETGNRQGSRMTREDRRVTREKIAAVGFSTCIKRIRWAREDATQSLILDLEQGVARYETFRDI